MPTNINGLSERTRSHIDTIKTISGKYVRGGGGRRGRGARDGATGRRGIGGPPLQAQLSRGQQTITVFLRK